MTAAEKELFAKLLAMVGRLAAKLEVVDGYDKHVVLLLEADDLIKQAKEQMK